MYTLGRIPVILVLTTYSFFRAEIHSKHLGKDCSTQFFCSGHILLSPTMPGTLDFFQPAAREQPREDGQEGPPELGQLHLHHCP